ncbi:hypothetical protein G6O69_13270 [Pseudenhygromyxa sp. WMMC2535]|uniref:hypothetical protein n=1 Tax=Pseudenhygromyxa sp. WMMC2535 TaxID=2712867 RepID=UPI001557ACC6|nr:hypothetical protein [Pseudenhygromyxa sp. WMMC2535]NVB38805.1 hypothetical protein [Pseudenhygromyxa sp. WMMC2535]
MRGVLVTGLSALVAGCLPENPDLDDTSTSASDSEGESEDDGVEAVTEGLLGCPAGERCTLVAVSQTLDDRVELYTAAGPGATYRGAFDLDFKPNLQGDNSGERLDEPYGLAWDGERLHVLLGHYPTRELSSLLSLPAAELAAFGDASWIDADDLASFEITGLEVTEALSITPDPAGGGALLVGVFANDLTVPEAAWTEPSQVLRVRPGEAPQATDIGCAGAWSMVEIAEDRLALACDGDEAMVIVDLNGGGGGGGDGGESGGGGESESLPTPACVGDVPFSSKRVRFLAPDQLGGVLLTEAPTIVSTTEDARLWWFDGGCGLRGFTTLEGASSWDLRQLVALPEERVDSLALDGPRWLLARADGDARGVLVLAGDPEAGSVEVCGRLDALDAAGAWTPEGGAELLEPHALALDAAGSGLAIGVGPANADVAGPGYGEVWWVELGEGDPCEGGDSLEPVKLSAAAPAVDPAAPQTWRRAPHVVEIIEVGP